MQYGTRMFKQQLLIFLIIFVRDASCVIDTLYHIAREVQKLYLLLDEVDLHNIMGPTEDDENPSYRKLKDQIDKIYEQLKKMESTMNSKVILSVANRLDSRPLVMRAVDTINLYIASIDSEYSKFDDCVTRNQLGELTKSVFRNIEPNILIIREMMTESTIYLPNERNMVAAITRIVTFESDKRCGAAQLISEVLVQTFRMVMIAEIKTHVMMGFSNRYLYVKNQGWDEMNSRASSQFQTYFASYVNILRENLELTENLYLRACDPDNGNWIQNENYFELTETVKAIIFRYYLADCSSHTCDNIGFRLSSKCDASYYGQWKECPNMSEDCTNLGSVKACILLGSPPRFHYINSTTLGFLGSNSQCPSDNSMITNDEFDPRYIRSSCSCDCYGNSSKISLSITESKVNLNRVITGLRFIRKKDILHIQVKEGLLEAQGYINKTTNKWSPIPSSIDPSQIHSIDRENKIFFLDDLRLPRGYVLTGIKFNRATRGTLIGFDIGIFGVPFEYTTGELRFRNKIGLSVETNIEGQPLLFKPINSVGTILPNKPSSKDLKYIKFQRSLLVEDFGQSTLPLFDAVPVATNPPSALDGIGIFHKGVTGYAGFISLRIYAIKYEKYFGDFKSAHIMENVVIFN